MKRPSRRPSARRKPLAPEEKARLAAAAADAMKAENILLLQVTELVNYADYFLICSGRSTRQVQAIAENILNVFQARKIRPLGVEGEREGNWILIDEGSVIIHVFYQPVREFYELEKLFSDAPQLPFPARPAKRE